VSGIPISWAVMHGGGSTNVASSTTDSSGTASVSWTLDTIAKPDSLRASIPSGDAMLVIAKAQHGKAVLAVKISGDSQTVALGGMSQPLIVRVADRYGNPVAGVAVAWFVTGGGTLSAITTVTDTSGTTQVTLSADPNASGAHQIIATYGFVRASTFTLNAAKL
jgi:adhesin/invasin